MELRAVRVKREKVNSLRAQRSHLNGIRLECHMDLNSQIEAQCSVAPGARSRDPEHITRGPKHLAPEDSGGCSDSQRTIA